MRKNTYYGVMDINTNHDSRERIRKALLIIRETFYLDPLSFIYPV